MENKYKITPLLLSTDTCLSDFKTVPIEKKPVPMVA